MSSSIRRCIVGLSVSWGVACGDPGPDPAMQDLVVRASPRGHRFDVRASVELATSRPARILYTVDGSPPSPGRALEYSGPLDVTSSTLLSFIAVSDDGIWSPPGSELYESSPPDVTPEKVNRLLWLDPDHLFIDAPPKDRKRIERTIRLRSMGTEPVHVRSVSLVPNPNAMSFFEDDVFRIGTVAPGILAPGRSLGVLVSYRPTETLRSAVLVVESDEERSLEPLIAEVWGREFEW